MFTEILETNLILWREITDAGNIMGNESGKKLAGVSKPVPLGAKWFEVVSKMTATKPLREKWAQNEYMNKNLDSFCQNKPFVQQKQPLTLDRLRHNSTWQSTWVVDIVLWLWDFQEFPTSSLITQTNHQVEAAASVFSRIKVCFCGWSLAALDGWI